MNSLKDEYERIIRAKDAEIAELKMKVNAPTITIPDYKPDINSPHFPNIIYTGDAPLDQSLYKTT